MTITASMVKTLREKTGAGMMDCKRALQEVDGDLEEAIKRMRETGLAKAEKRAGRVAAEGVIVLQGSENHDAVFMAELNTETDFVARDDSFIAFAAEVGQRGLKLANNDLSAVTAMPFGDAATLDDARCALMAKTGENIELRRVAFRRAPEGGVVAQYRHGQRIGVVVVLDKADEALGRDIAMHIAATSPAAIDESGVSAELLANEREIYTGQARESGKTDEGIIQKIIEGKLKKYLKEICLLSQSFVKDPDQTVEALLKAKGATILDFVRFEVGEGIEKETIDFADEVKAQVEGNA